MADTKISALTGATTPLAGTEVVPVVQGGETRKVPVSDLTAGRAVAASALTLTGASTATSFTLANSGGGTNATVAVTENVGVTINLNEGATARQLIIQQGGVETWRLNASGNLAAADGKGIDFSATAGTGTSELLADYEEGTWTATLIGTTTPPTTPVTVTGAYTKIGRQVTVTFAFNAANTTGAAGDMRVTGLPFTSGSYTATGPVGKSGLGGSVSVSYVPSSNTIIQFLDAVALSINSITAATDRFLYAEITYFV